MFVRLILIVLALLALRRALGWISHRWGALLDGGSRRAGADSRHAAPGPSHEVLSDQRIEEADYEELP